MRVLVVDDHEVVRRGVCTVLLNVPGCDLCGEAVDGRDAVEKARQLKPDVIVMDISMPNLNGLEATRLLRNLLPDTEVLIMSQHESPAMIQQAFKAGARGYVVKSSLGKDLVNALEKVARHETYVDGGASQADRSGHTDAQEILQRSAALEKALRESEELYRSTFDRAALGVAHVAEDGQWLRVNDALCKILGYSEAELLKMKFQDITHPDDLVANLIEIEKVRTGAVDTFSVEKRYLRKDGSIVWVNLTVAGARDTNGRIKHFISVIEEITGRRDSEEARARLAAIVESSDDAIVSKNLDGIIKSWNAAATRIFGFTAEEAIGNSITIIIPAELREEEAQILRRLRSGERIDHFETVRRTKFGKNVNVSLSISPVRDAKGRIIGASKIARDITERKRVEEALVESRSHLALALESTKTAIFDWDVVEKRGKWNSQLVAIYNFHPKGEFITAEEWQQRFHAEDAARLAQEYELTLRDKNEFGFEFRTAQPNGDVKWILSHGRVVRDGNGRAVRLIGLHTDITDRKHAEQELEQRQRALKESEVRLREAFGQTYSFFVLLELDGTIIDANRAALEASGCTREKVVGRKFWEPWWSSLPAEVKALQEAIARAADGHSTRGESYFCLADGRLRFADRTLNPVFDEAGNVVVIVATWLDMTEQKELRDELEQRVEQRTRQLEEKNRALSAQTETVRDLSGRLLRAQDEERRRIARELHDSAGQIIAALQMNLMPLQAEAQNLSSPDTVKECVELVNQLSNELRTVSYLLHPPLLDEVGLSSAIRWYVEGFAERSKIDVEVDIAPDLGRLPQDMEMTIFRIVQESLTNIHRHSGSKTAKVRVCHSSEEVRLEILDAGSGIATSNGHGSSARRRVGVGIQGMRERIRQLGGTIAIVSNEGGTLVSATLPLPASTMEVSDGTATAQFVAD